jgi:hypothetical protein
MSRPQSAALARITQPAFFYLDLKDTVRRAALLTMVVRDEVPTVASLKREYARALAQLSRAPLNTALQPRIVTGGPVLRLARARGLIDDSVRSSSYRTDSQTVAIRHIRHALIVLGLQHPPLRALCDLLITDILCWPSVESRSGSVGNLFGTVWLSPSDDLTSLDIAENLIHEMVHLNLDLADMTFGLFTRAPGSQFKAHSAVLGRRRPYHLAFHSACVAVSIIYFRLFVGMHGEIDALRSSLQRCTSELLDHPAAFTGYAWNAILAAQAFSRAPRLAAIPVHQDLTARLIQKSRIS